MRSSRCAASASDQPSAVLRTLAEKAAASSPGDEVDRHGMAQAPLRQGLGPAEAGDSLSAMTSYPLFAELTDGGWSSRKYQSWLVDSINRLILDL